MFGRMHLSDENEKLARQYLDMEKEENPALLARLQHQDLSSLFPMNGYAEYLKWLRKNKRREELARYVRFVVELGGSTSWLIFVNDNFDAKLPDLESMLTYLTGEYAEEQKMAVRAALCARRLREDGSTAETRMLCELGKENPEVFRRALEYCYIFKQEGLNNRYQYDARMLLTAVYLYCMEPGTAPELAGQLAQDLIADIPIFAYSGRALKADEVQCLQNYLRTAGKDTPFPQRVLSILKAHKGSADSAFPAGCAFLALRHSVKFELMFRLTLGGGFIDIYRITPLAIARGIVEDDDYFANMAEIQEMLPLLDEDYIIWSLYGPSEAYLLYNMHAECDAEIRRMAVDCPEGIRAAAGKANSEEYRKLTAIVQNANLALYEEIHASYQEKFMEKFALELTEWYNSESRETARRYLAGQCSLEDLVSEMECGGGIYSGRLISPLYKRVFQLKELGEYQLYRRAVLLEAVKGCTDYFEEYPVAEGNIEEAAAGVSLLCEPEQITALLEIFSMENVPVSLQLKALGRICDRVDNKKDRIRFLDACAAAATQRQLQNPAQWEEGLLETLQQSDTTAHSISLKILAGNPSVEKFKEVLLAIAQNCTDQTQKLLVEIFKKHIEWETEILSLLESKKQKVRGFAVLILEEWAQRAHLSAVKAALAKETNKKLAAQLQALAAQLDIKETQTNETLSGQQSYQAEKQLAASLYRGNKKRKVEWVQDIQLPAVHFQKCQHLDNTLADEQELVLPEYMYAILAAYADMEILGIEQDAGRLAAPLVPQELAAYVRALYNSWMAAGAEAKKRWVLYAAALHGDAEMIAELHRQIKDWADHSRGAVAAEAVRAMALNGSSQALLLVDQMARKYKSNQIKNAAKDALSDAAEALGISREELEDRIVPDFGFNTQMEQVLDYGSRTFTVRLNLALEIEIYDESGKQLKSMPKPGKQDDIEKASKAQEALKQLKKQLKLVVESQKLRLEQALSTARFWKTPQWTKLFVNNPIMHQFAIGLIWGIYEDGQLTITFRYMEDGSFNTVDEQEYMLPADAMIGLVHPMEMSQQLLTAWKEQLTDYEITQPVEQLERPIYHVTQEEVTAQKIMRFYDKELNCLSLSAKLLKLGWERGEVLDGGFFDNFSRYDSYGDDRYGAELTFSGCSVGYSNEDVSINELYFYKYPDNTYHAQRCAPNEVSERYFSEVILQIARIVGE